MLKISVWKPAYAFCPSRNELCDWLEWLKCDWLKMKKDLLWEETSYSLAFSALSFGAPDDSSRWFLPAVVNPALLFIQFPIHAFIGSFILPKCGGDNKDFVDGILTCFIGTV